MNCGSVDQRRPTELQGAVLFITVIHMNDPCCPKRALPPANANDSATDWSVLYTSHVVLPGQPGRSADFNTYSVRGKHKSYRSVCENYMPSPFMSSFEIQPSKQYHYNVTVSHQAYTM